jgi:DNA-binding transcriptional LysR family regulator
VRLLQRTTRKLSLTEAGELYHRHSVAVREEAEAATEALAMVQTEPRGTIHIVCPLTVAQTTVGPLIPLFLKAHPQVRIEMQVTNRVVDLVQDGVDVALRVRQTLDESGSVVVKKLGTSYGRLVASPAQLKREGRPHTVEDLAKLSTVAMSSVDGKTSWKLIGPNGREHDFQHRPIYTADDLMTLKYAVMEGTGVSIIPDYMCRRDIERGDLEIVLPEWSPRPGIMHAVFPSRRGLVPAVRRFLDFLGEHVTEEGLGNLCP